MYIIYMEKADCNASVHLNTLLDNNVDPTLWQQLGEGPLLWFSQFGVEELDLNSIQHLCDDLE